MKSVSTACLGLLLYYDFLKSIKKKTSLITGSIAENFLFDLALRLLLRTVPSSSWLTYLKCIPWDFGNCPLKISLSLSGLLLNFNLKKFILSNHLFHHGAVLKMSPSVTISKRRRGIYQPVRTVQLVFFVTILFPSHILETTCGMKLLVEW